MMSSPTTNPNEEIALRLEGVAVDAGTFQMRNVDLALPAGKWCVLMGRTGSGKTTLLDTICGLRPLVSGRILIGGHDVTDASPSERGIGYVPQDGALFNRSTVRQHLEFGLTVGNRQRLSRSALNQRVESLAQLLKVSPLLKRYPSKLSGGERQRVALGRALAHQPALLLLDEPLSALDDDTREEMYELIRRVRQETNVTALHVTHCREESSRLGDVMLKLADGCIQEQSAETELANPENRSRSRTPS